MIRSRRAWVYPLVFASLAFVSGYILGNLQNRREQTGVRVRRPPFGPGRVTPPGAGLAGASPSAFSGLARGSGPLLDFPDDSTTSTGVDDDPNDLQAEMTDQEAALLEHATIAELARSLMDSGIPDGDIEGTLAGVATYRMERQMRRERLPGHDVRSKEDRAREFRASLLEASASDADVENMVNALLAEDSVPADANSEILPPVP